MLHHASNLSNVTLHMSSSENKIFAYKSSEEADRIVATIRDMGIPEMRTVVCDDLDLQVLQRFYSNYAIHVLD